MYAPQPSLRWVVCLVGLLCMAEALHGALVPEGPIIPGPYLKKVNGPARDFERHRVTEGMSGSFADASLVLDISKSYAVDYKLKKKGDFYEAIIPFEVDTLSELQVSALSKHARNIHFDVKAPNETEWLSMRDAVLDTYSLEQFVHSTFGMGLTSGPTLSFGVSRPSLGTWNVRIRIPTSIHNVEHERGMLFVDNMEAPHAKVELRSLFDARVGRELHLLTGMSSIQDIVDEEHDDEDRIFVAEQYEAVMTKAVTEVRLASTDEVVTTFEHVTPQELDEASAQQLKQDNLLVGVFMPEQRGIYSIETQVTARSALTGRTLHRTLMYTLAVERDDVVIDHRPVLLGQIDVDDATRFVLPVLVGSSMGEEFHQDARVRVYAEVYDATTDEPLCFVGGIVPVETIDSIVVVRLSVHHAWIGFERASVVVKNVVLFDAETNIPLVDMPTAAHDMEVTLSERVVAGVLDAAAQTIRALDFDEAMEGKAMFEGRRPAEHMDFGGHVGSCAPDLCPQHAHLLVHGYCSPASPYPGGDFVAGMDFRDYKQSRTTDHFARLVMEQGSVLESFGLVAHSHGGPASIHLHAYYHSKLEDAEGERLVQSVGSPYLGAPTAGRLAAIGRVIGVGCGTNHDLTLSGAEAWVTALPMEPRKDVYYYYTSYKKEWFKIGFCNLAANAILARPNDGVVEPKRCILEGAHKMEYALNECHSANLHHPAQCKDPERNAALEAHGAK